jgi:hypothetical protein
MRKMILISIAIAVLIGTGLASAQTFTFSAEHGQMLRQHATSQHYNSFNDPNFHAQVGGALPHTVDIHPLPDALVPHVPQAHQYGYGVVNDHPVIVDHSNRQIIHHFD